MKYYIQCPYPECSRVFEVPWEKKNELMKCPHCSQQLFCDRSAIIKLEDHEPRPNSILPNFPEGPTSKIELVCVGNVGRLYIFAQINVIWYEVTVDHERRHIDVREHHIPIRNYTRKDRVNYVTFYVPENVICSYRRHVEIKPSTEEQRYFCMKGGQFVDLGEQGVCDYGKKFLSEYRNYEIMHSSGGYENSVCC